MQTGKSCKVSNPSLKSVINSTLNCSGGGTRPIGRTSCCTYFCCCHIQVRLRRPGPPYRLSWWASWRLYQRVERRSKTRQLNPATALGRGPPYRRPPARPRSCRGGGRMHWSASERHGRTGRAMRGCWPCSSSKSSLAAATSQCHRSFSLRTTGFRWARLSLVKCTSWPSACS